MLEERVPPLSSAALEQGLAVFSECQRVNVLGLWALDGPPQQLTSAREGQKQPQTIR